MTPALSVEAVYAVSAVLVTGFVAEEREEGQLPTLIFLLLENIFSQKM